MLVEVGGSNLTNHFTLKRISMDNSSKNMDELKEQKGYRYDYDVCVKCLKFAPIYKNDGTGSPLCYKCATSKNSGQGSPIEKGYKYQRNEPCFCGSGKKYKNCCKDKVDNDSSNDSDN